MLCNSPTAWHHSIATSFPGLGTGSCNLVAHTAGAVSFGLCFAVGIEVLELVRELA